MPAEQQDSLAQLLLYELEEDERWQQSTTRHADKLKGFVADILEAERRGECEPLDPDIM